MATAQSLSNLKSKSVPLPPLSRGHSYQSYTATAAAKSPPPTSSGIIINISKYLGGKQQGGRSGGEPATNRILFPGPEDESDF